MICFHFSFFFKAHLKLLQTTTCNCLFFYYVFLYFRRFSQLKMATRATSALFLLKILYIFSSRERVEELLPTGLNHYSFLYCLTGGLLLPLLSLSSFCHQTDQQPKKKYLSSSSEKRKLNRQNFAVLLVKRKCRKTKFYGAISKKGEREIITQPGIISLEL